MEEKKKDRKKFSLFNVLLGIFVLLFSLFVAYIIVSAFFPYTPSENIRCQANMHQLSIGFLCQKVDTGQYPPPGAWCESVKEFLDEESNPFFCKADKTGPCSYAMNENIPADANDLPDDLVLLFESDPGWNQTGGPDDVVTDRHGKPGANIAFADGHVEFVEAEDIPKLRWTLENKSVERQ